MDQHRGFLRDEDGATAIEYALIALLIAMVCLAAMTLMAGRVTAMWNTIAAHV